MVNEVMLRVGEEAQRTGCSEVSSLMKRRTVMEWYE